MAVVIVNEIQGGNQDLYDKVTPRVMEGDKLPQGCQIHIAGPIDDGWRVITVWDSEEEFNEFRDNTLVPALQDTGEGDRVAPNITAKPVYKLITA